METKLLRVDAVLQRVGMGKTKLYRMLGEGKFPLPVAVEGSRAWRSNEIEEWIASLPKAEK